MVKYVVFFCFLTTTGSDLLGQDSLERRSNLTWGGFVDAYYSYDFSKPFNHEKASFLFNHNRHNEVTINLAMATLSYRDSAKRASLALMAGTYAQYNLASEPELLQHIYEVNVGIKLVKRKDVWIDAGILPSHIGFESAISKDCWTLTRSILAENSPYFEAGVRASYKTSNQKWYIPALFLNGWQRIQKVEGNSTPSFGTQVTYMPTNGLSLNSSTFAGNDKPDSVRKWRCFHNFYLVWQFSDRLGVTLAFDVGLEQVQKGSSNVNSWYSPLIIMRYQYGNWAVAARAEYYDDEGGVIAPLINSKPFEMQGYSLNIDRKAEKVLFRIEGKLFHNSSTYFIHPFSLSLNNFQLTSSLSFSF